MLLGELYQANNYNETKDHNKTSHIDGELTILPDEDITIILENFLLNADLQMDLYGRRKRRAVQRKYKGILRIGTAQNPVPCDKKVTIKLMGNVSEAEDYGALGNSIPVGAKAIGGYGSVEMHGCHSLIIIMFL